MSIKFLQSQTLASALLPAFLPFENFILLHTIDEVPGYDGQ